MGRLIPGRVRREGIELYQAKKIILLERFETSYRFQVGQEDVYYDMDDRMTNCTCEAFAVKSYCQHLAGVEYFLKHQEVDVQDKGEADEKDRQRQQEHLFASRFLDGLERVEATQVTYHLSAYGEWQVYRHQLLWTLKIRRLPDKRYYIIRDIAAFVTMVQQESYYQIGKNYYEPLAYELFDEPARALLDFLSRLATSNHQVFFPDNGRHLYLPSGFFEEGLTLMGQLEKFSYRVEFGEEEASAHILPLTAEQELFRFRARLELSSIELDIEEAPFQLLFNEASYLYHRSTIYALTHQQQRLILALMNLPVGVDWQKHLSFDLADQERLAEHLMTFACLGPVDVPQALTIRDFKPRFDLDVTRDGRLSLRTSLDYGDVAVSDEETFAQLPFTSNHKRLKRLRHQLTQLGFAPTLEASRPLPTGADLYEFLGNGLAQLRRLGQVSLSSAAQELSQIQEPAIQLSQSGGLLEVNFDFSGLAPEDVSLALKSLQAQDAYFINRSGQVVIFDDEVRKVSQTLIDLRAKQVGDSQFHLDRLASFQLKDALSGYDKVSFSQELEEMVTHLAQPETFTIGDLAITAQLRDYQTLGVQWLSVLDHYGFGGVLADDMGLGKTLQTIAFLSRPLLAGKKALIITPSSLIYNWQDECRKFLPQAELVVAQGSKAEREQAIAKAAAVTLTSYHSFRQDLETYQGYAYDYLILDEAQAVKNSQTKLAQALRAFDVPRCFALSGTPIENRLLEIWSLFQIVLPGLFPSKAKFSALSAGQVAKMVQPFVLRRKKEDVLPELPEVMEITYHNEMSQEQKALYLAQLERMTNQLSQTSEAEFTRHKLEFLAGLTRLRQICNTPQLFMPFEGASGKLDSLRDLLHQVKANGHRVLIFSQFTTMLDVVEEMLPDLGLSTYKLTGATSPKERQEMTKAFNRGSRDAFLMSLKAGGVGLNLTGADTVVLIDLWWNPAVEEQAIGRAHRLGQEKVVQVYRLITKGSIEEKIQQLQESKRHLVQDVLEGTEARTSLTLEEMKQILGMI